jgi:Na+-driven multidrug efflux pump
MIARLGTAAYAAYSITTSIQGLGLFFSMGCATTCAILVGQRIGAGKDQEAFQIAKRILFISVCGSFVVGLLLIAIRAPLMDLYRVSDSARRDASAMLLIAGLTLWLRSLDPMFIVGILRSGGDTRFSALIDVGAIWLAGIPAVALAAFVFHLPVEWVFCTILLENVIKNAIGLQRFLSKNWMRNLTQAPAPG